MTEVKEPCSYSELSSGAKRKHLRDVIPLNVPFGLFIEPTNICNFHCSFCARNQSEFADIAGGFRHMSLPLFRKIVSDVKDMLVDRTGGGATRLKVVRLYYTGEPFACPDIMAMLRIISDAKITERIEITTNASLLNEGMAHGVLDAVKGYDGVLYMRYSIYSVIKERHLAVTHNPIDIHVVQDNVARFQKLRDASGAVNVSTYAKKLHTYDNEDDEFLTIYRPLVDEVALEEPMQWSGYGGVDLLKDAFTPEQEAMIAKRPRPKACSYPFTTMAIMSDGHVVVCCVDWSRKTLIGDVNIQSLADIWHGEKLRALQRLHLTGHRCDNEACANCDRMPRQAEDNLDDVSPSVLDK